MLPIVIEARNVNDALDQGINIMAWDHNGDVRRIPSRANAAGTVVLEHAGAVVTHYSHPRERVLFSAQRNANPFFHFMEALWILAGRRDVTWIAHFNTRMREFSDNGHAFHGAYGDRLRSPQDQLRYAIRMLSDDTYTRRCVLGIYDPARDLNTASKDIPCNLSLDFLVRDGAVHLTVFNRSNDMVWGAYGANAVQFSSILEVIAQSLMLPVGTYTQVSNSFHVYEGETVWERLRRQHDDCVDLYASHVDPVEPYDMLTGVPELPPGARFAMFDKALTTFMHFTNQNVLDGSLLAPGMTLPYFERVAKPLFNAWQCYKAGDVDEASDWIAHCEASDWRVAALSWLKRTRLGRAAIQGDAA